MEFKLWDPRDCYITLYKKTINIVAPLNLVSQSVRVDGQLSEEVRVYIIYGCLQMTDCIMYRKIMDSSDISKLQMDLNRLGEWAVENKMRINPDKSKAVSFTKAGVKEQIGIILGNK